MHIRDTATSSKPQLFSLRGPAGVHDGVRRSSLPWARALLPLALVAAGCGRTEIDPAWLAPTDAGLDSPFDAPIDLPVDRFDAPPDRPVDPPGDAAPPPGCVPQPEVCNGIDDDCNGQVDDGLPPIPCSGGGSRFCVAGAYSACPKSCEVCVPGSSVVCYQTICTHWGFQTCASDGRSFGRCTEAQVPSDCKTIAEQASPGPELEQCCLDAGYCCLDSYDLDNDGDRTEMLGQCGAVACTN